MLLLLLTLPIARPTSPLALASCSSCYIWSPASGKPSPSTGCLKPRPCRRTISDSAHVCSRELPPLPIGAFGNTLLSDLVQGAATVTNPRHEIEQQLPYCESNAAANKNGCKQGITRENVICLFRDWTQISIRMAGPGDSFMWLPICILAVSRDSRCRQGRSQRIAEYVLDRYGCFPDLALLPKPVPGQRAASSHSVLRCLEEYLGGTSSRTAQI
ncbi:hypothetical protein BD289DRAFT_121858 [Coniella lustricola]|uniref:Uncharacterized protein n=1 Tax=Coniella lustricola TaxID=2025994 RepID=A0A2T2ZWI3_9PEZI|nr:hypothetical protein BD289DRAFT_121858 [Coniella lustricola]